MDCPNCNTWNPDDKDVCWRCQAPLPKPTPPKKKRQYGGMPMWVWVALIAIFAATILGQCFFLPGIGQ